ncbi:MAG: hypothetical protein A3J62_03520 [Candidatus Buchananbacteria bacterium RIFCSPHIGHO2_02_FULL_38_8]|uniref:General secretion pathway GspH domain-containing protein n=2 Tax=Candidatus Buchananiibacteriota TaxID=1817903 RepID=A0A1G1XT59_9BACT|nr:MAG: hypothetical protein A2731_03610 [Candidatus Buchananbacteria bacterium RIFCSPHIGHO2_01_FULL_39_8]OGY47233.1 MAG: hypothetical protein A3J62_03520 [Candidatus Buchananbacteria bacterium RIFCSPHIGHO2_02_FULL_38_8]
MIISNIRKKDGLSVVELVVTLLIISLITVISIPLFVNYQKTTKLRSEAQLLATNLRLAQQLAITEQIIYDLVLLPDVNKYQIVNSETSQINKTVTLNPEVSINEINGFSANTIRFNPIGGVIEDGYIILVNTRNAASTIQIKPSGYVQTTY